MKGYIYSIRSYQTKDIYIGSTERELNARMNSHISSYKSWINGDTNNCKSFEILEYGDAYIELIIEVEVQSKPELRRIEGEYQLKTECVNTRIAGRTKKEYQQEHKEEKKVYHKKYYESNKEQIIEQHKEYCEANKTQINEKRKEYYEANTDMISDRQKKYYEANKEKFSEINKKYSIENAVKLKKYREANKERRSKRTNEKITCECGKICNKSSILIHSKSKKHINFINKPV